MIAKAPKIGRRSFIVGTAAAGGGLALGLYMAFTMKANAVTSLLYAAFEGVFLGAISRIFNDHFHGIAVQAVAGTVMVAGGMLFVYKIGAIRVTPRFTRVVVGATIGVFGLMIINMIAYLFHPGGLGLRSGGVNGRQLELKVSDSQSSNPGAVLALSKMASEGGYTAFIGPVRSTQIQAMAPKITIHSGKVIQVSSIRCRMFLTR
jgi:hypothetical protein